MILFSNRLARALPLAALALLTACGADVKPVEAPAGATDTPSAVASVAATPPPVEAAASATPSATPAASGSADAKPAPKPSSGRPAVLKSDPNEVTDTFGSSPGAKIIIGTGTFKIPENALHTGTVITVKVDPKAKSTGVPIGKVFHITAFVPPANQPSNIVTDGPNFELILPAGNKKDANLAIGTVVTDDAGKEKITWQIIAPKRIDDAAGLAYFELTGFSDTLLHVTAKPVTGDKK